MKQIINGTILNHNSNLILVLISNKTIYTFNIQSSYNNNSILSLIENYKLLPNINVDYEEINIQTMVQTDKIVKYQKEEIIDDTLVGYITPNLKEVAQNIIANHYFYYNFLLMNNICDYNEQSEELKNTYFKTDIELYNNTRYKEIITKLLDRNNYISFIKDINKKYNENLDVDSTFYDFLQEVKKAYQE